MIEERVFKIIKDNIEVEIDHELTPDDSIDDLKINSISFIKIIVGIFIFWSAWNSIWHRSWRWNALISSRREIESLC